MKNSIVCLASHKFDKSSLMQSPKKYNIETFQGNEDGRFDVEIKDINFECYAKVDNCHRLYVLFTSAGRKDSSTRFMRASWSHLLNGVVLCIEDPMYKKYTGLTDGWYYGDENGSYLDLSIEIVKKVCKSRRIPYENVVFFGSSAGGYAALYSANKLPRSSGIASNPQIRIRDWPASKNLVNIAGVNLVEDDEYGRNCLRYIEKNKSSRFYIWSNLSSKQDKIQIAPWLELLGIPSMSGVYKKNNIMFINNHVVANNNHSIHFDYNALVVFLCLIRDNKNIDIGAINAWRSDIEEKFLFSEKLSRIEIWNNFLMQDFPTELNVPSWCHTRHLHITMEDVKKGWFYRFTMYSGKKLFRLMLRIPINSVINNIELENDLRKLAARANAKVNIDKYYDVVLPPLPVSNMYQSFVDFHNIVYPGIKIRKESKVYG